jgi:hypothetical protein
MHPRSALGGDVLSAIMWIMKKGNPENPFFQKLQKTYNREVIAHQRIVRQPQDAVGIQKQAEVDSRLPDPAIAQIRRDLEQIINDGKK